MNFAPRRQIRRTHALVIAASALALTACGASPKVALKKPTQTKEYFAESEYGVKASPRVAYRESGLPRGGGRDQLGKPYQIKGKWYYPQVDPDYQATGLASWYGDAFHGRLTANGEIYDMTHLTAAHPTMPLPSYARVTNMKNGSSVIVRVNDRGPFHGGRVIDLSRRAAELLDYTQSGVAKVEVEYLGRAPLHGRDAAFLMASYQPGDNIVPDPSDGLPAGVMIAMNGPTPTMPVAAPAAALAGAMHAPAIAGDFAAGHPPLPAFGPIVPERPALGIASVPGTAPALPVLSYADQRVAGAAGALEAFAAHSLSADDIVQSWKRQHGAPAIASPVQDEHIAVGTFATEADARKIAAVLASAGRTSIAAGQAGEGYVLTLHADGRHDVDEMLMLAWKAGAADAFTVRR